MTDHNHVRANRNGDPCPDWCTRDHDAPLVGGLPEFGWRLAHLSDVMTHELGAAEVRLHRSSLAGEPAKVRVSHHLAEVLSLSAAQSDKLADMLEDLPGSTGLAQLIDELRAAALMLHPSHAERPAH